jgi:hypothetical protein
MKLLEVKTIGKKWAKGDKKRRRSVILETTIVAILELWKSETRVLANKKKVITNVIARNVREMHCCNPSLGFMTKERACKVAGQEGSPRVTFHVLGSAKECEGMNPHTPK